MKVTKLNEAWGNAPAWLKKELNLIKRDSSDHKDSWYSAYDGTRIYTVPRTAGTKHGYKMGKAAIGVSDVGSRLLNPEDKKGITFYNELVSDGNLYYYGIDFKDAMYEFSQGKFYSEPVPTSTKSPLLKDPNLITVFRLANDQVYIRQNDRANDGLINGNLSFIPSSESRSKFIAAGLEDEFDAVVKLMRGSNNYPLKYINMTLLLKITTEFGYYKIDELPNAFDKLKSRASKYKDIGTAYNGNAYATDYSRSKVNSERFKDGSITASTNLRSNSGIENKSTSIYGYRNVDGDYHGWYDSRVYNIDKSGYNVSLAHAKLIDRLNKLKADKFNVNLQDTLDILARAEDFIKNLDYRHSDRYVVQETVALAAMVNQAYGELDRAIDDIECARLDKPNEKNAIIASGFSKIKPLIKAVKDNYNEIVDKLYERKKYVPLTLD